MFALTHEEVRVQARLLAATNKDLAAAVKSGNFREDLYYRLNVVQIRMPALREAADDIPLLASALLAEQCRELGRQPPEISPEALACLRQYRWPGNVRELGNEMKRLAVMVRRERIEAADLAEVIRATDGSATNRGEQLLSEAVAELERQMIVAALGTYLVGLLPYDSAFGTIIVVGGFIALGLVFGIFAVRRPAGGPLPITAAAPAAADGS